MNDSQLICELLTRLMTKKIDDTLYSEKTGLCYQQVIKSTSDGSDRTASVLTTEALSQYIIIVYLIYKNIANE